MNWSEINNINRVGIILLGMLVFILCCIIFIFIPLHFYNESVNHKSRMEYYKYRIITKGYYYYTNNYEEIGNCIKINNTKHCGEYEITIIN